MDITPEIADTVLTIARYGRDGVVIDGVSHTEPLALFAQRVEPLPSLTPEALTQPDMYAMFAGEAEIVLVGAGERGCFLPPSLRETVKAQYGLVLDAMDTGAACRTYNVLIAESRPVAALLMPLG